MNATCWHNIQHCRILVADVGFRVFKRSQLVGQWSFYGNTKGSLGLIFTQNSLQNYNDVVTFVNHDGGRRIQAIDGKREKVSLLLLLSAILKIVILPGTKT